MPQLDSVSDEFVLCIIFANSIQNRIKSRVKICQNWIQIFSTKFEMGKNLDLVSGIQLNDCFIPLDTLTANLNAIEGIAGDFLLLYRYTKIGKRIEWNSFKTENRMHCLSLAMTMRFNSQVIRLISIEFKTWLHFMRGTFAPNKINIKAFDWWLDYFCIRNSCKH